MDAIQPYLDYFSHHPGWAVALVFVVAFGEALLIIGLFVPSTAVLVGAGMLVGAGHLGFWAVFSATVAGAVLGDQLSYWAGRLYGHRLKRFWPLSLYPNLVARGEEFVRLHGGKSIAIGRFVPGVKAVVPGIVGMFGMNQAAFAAVNLASGLVWAAAHILPGALLGQMLALAGDVSGRLVAVLVILLAILAVAGWLIRLCVAGLAPWIYRAQTRVHAWAMARPEPHWRQVGQAIAPDNPRAMAVLVFAAVAVTALIGLLRLITGILAYGAFANADVSVFNMLQSIRNAPADELMIVVTMFGDGIVMFALAIAMIGWLAWRRAWRAALAVGIAFVAAKLFVPVMKLSLGRPYPVELSNGADALRFPSGHTALATVCFGVLAVLASQSLGRWGRALVFALCGLAVIAIAYSRLYLGVHWLSDVLGGLLFGAVMTAAFGIAIEATSPRRIMPSGLAATAVAAFLAAGAFHVGASFATNAGFYAARPAAIRLTLAAWQAGAWAAIPKRRIDLAGKLEESFLAQWAGDVAELAAALQRDGWTETRRWTWRAGLAYLDPHAKLADLPPRPALHQGLKAERTFIKTIPAEPAERLVLRIWASEYQIAGALQPIRLVSLTRDVLKKRFNLYALPSPAPALGPERKAVLATLESAESAEALAAAGSPGPVDSKLIRALP